MSAGSRIAVITPYHREAAAMLRQCHQSVLAQNLPADHFLIADGRPLAEVAGWNVRHVQLPQAHGDNGNTPRGLGALLAQSEGYDFIAYLDADNWYRPEHLASLLELARRDAAAVCASFRSFHDLAGDPLDVSDEDEDTLRHVDTSCLLIGRPAFASLQLWLTMPKILAPVCDRVYFAGLLHQGHAVRSTARRTVAFRSRYEAHYRIANAPVPESAKPGDLLQPVRDYLLSQQGVTECVNALGFWPPSYVTI